MVQYKDVSVAVLLARLKARRRLQPAARVAGQPRTCRNLVPLIPSALSKLVAFPLTDILTTVHPFEAVFVCTIALVQRSGRRCTATSYSLSVLCAISAALNRHSDVANSGISTPEMPLSRSLLPFCVLDVVLISVPQYINE